MFVLIYTHFRISCHKFDTMQPNTQTRKSYTRNTSNLWYFSCVKPHYSNKSNNNHHKISYCFWHMLLLRLRQLRQPKYALREKCQNKMNKHRHVVKMKKTLKKIATANITLDSFQVLQTFAVLLFWCGVKKFLYAHLFRWLPGKYSLIICIPRKIHCACLFLFLFLVA